MITNFAFCKRKSNLLDTLHFFNKITDNNTMCCQPSRSNSMSFQRRRRDNLRSQFNGLYIQTAFDKSLRAAATEECVTPFHQIIRPCSSWSPPSPPSKRRRVDAEQVLPVATTTPTSKEDQMKERNADQERGKIFLPLLEDFTMVADTNKVPALRLRPRFESLEN